MSYTFSSQALWRVDKGDPSKIRCGPDLVAEVHTTDDDPYPEYALEANARLVAAAPRMYRYLEGLNALVSMYLNAEEANQVHIVNLKVEVRNVLSAVQDLEHNLRLTYTRQHLYELQNQGEQNA